MPALSAVILTFNEEHNIGRCIDSVAGLAEDIVVVDSFSTDATEEICREKGVRFIRHPFEGYIQQKNWALTQARFDHCLSLDADEALSPALRSSIEALPGVWDAEGYTMNRLTNYCGRWIRHCGWYPDVKLRLFDRRLGSWEGINPHDEYRLRKGGRTRHLRGDILHYSYYTISDHIRQVEHFSSVAAGALHEKGVRAGWVKLYLSPTAKFFRDYLLNAGFLDGFEGFTICRVSALATFIKYAKLRHLHKQSTVSHDPH
ncbi:MAG TPA: glycosyltransferase family 2 protein [Bacteroidales bacterium]|nr:glycosyltransferase family 2 protein [Bacteroidales bacterium]